MMTMITMLRCIWKDKDKDKGTYKDKDNGKKTIDDDEDDNVEMRMGKRGKGRATDCLIRR